MVKGSRAKGLAIASGVVLGAVGLAACQQHQAEGSPKDEPKPVATAASAVDSIQCEYFEDREAIREWARRMRGALKRGEWKRAKTIARCLSGDLDLSLQTQPVRQGVDVFPGQLDFDDAEEWVVQVWQRSAPTGPEQRVDNIWIGVLDAGPGGHRLVAQIARPESQVCEAHGRLGLKFGFRAKQPGPLAALQVTEQEITTCWPETEVSDRVRHLRLAAGRLVDVTPAEETPAEGVSANGTAAGRARQTQREPEAAPPELAPTAAVPEPAAGTEMEGGQAPRSSDERALSRSSESAPRLRSLLRHLAREHHGP